MVDIKDLRWLPRIEIERDMLPLVKPAPKDEAEREQLIEGLLALTQRCGKAASGQTMNRVMGRLLPQVKEWQKKVTKAADLLEETGLDFQDIVKDLRGRARNLGSHLRPQGAPKKTGQAECVRLCQEFLKANDKHAGIGQTGLAVKLAQFMWEISTWDRKTGEGYWINPATLAKSNKRNGRGGQKD